MSISLSDDGLWKLLRAEIIAGHGDHMKLMASGLPQDKYWREVGYLDAIEDILQMEKKLRNPTAEAPVSDHDELQW